jgi:hypothetical protein
LHPARAVATPTQAFLWKSRSSVGRAGDTPRHSVLARSRAEGIEGYRISRSRVRISPALPNCSYFGAHGRMPRATGSRSSTAQQRARCRRATSQCPMRAGPRGRTTPRCGCDSRRSGYHILARSDTARDPSPPPCPRYIGVGAGPPDEGYLVTAHAAGSNPGSPVSRASRSSGSSQLGYLSLSRKPWPREPGTSRTLSSARHRHCAIARCSRQSRRTLTTRPQEAEPCWISRSTSRLASGASSRRRPSRFPTLPRSPTRRADTLGRSITGRGSTASSCSAPRAGPSTSPSGR